MGIIPPKNAACSTSDVVWFLLCDLVDDTTTQFLRRISTHGTSVDVDDFELDATTPYVVAGTVEECPSSVSTPPVSVDLYTLDQEDCDGNLTTVDALPVVQQGINKVKLCDDQPVLDVAVSGEVEVTNDSGNPLAVSGDVSVNNFPSTQDVNVVSSVEVEVKNDDGNPLPVSGTVSVDSLPAITGTVTIEPGVDPIVVDIGSFPASVEVSNDAGNPLPVSGTVDVTDGGGSLTVDGSVSVSNFPTTQDVNIVGGVELEFKNDTGNPLPVSDGGGSLTVDGSVAVSNFPASQPVTGPLTDAELRATPVPVSGTITVGSLPEVEIKNDTGNPIPVSGTVTITDGSGPVTVDGTVDVGNFPAVQPVSDNGTTLSVDDGGGSLTVDGTVAVSNFPASVEVSNDSGNPLPVNGTVTVQDGGGSITVDGTVNVGNFPATQNVAVTSSVEVEVKNDTGSAIPVTGPLTDTQLRATPVPVSGTVTVSDGSGPLTVDGTVTANQGSANTNPNAWPTKISDGTDTVGISTLAGAKALKVDVIQQSGFVATNAISATNFNLAAAAYTATSALANDCILDKIELRFSTTQSKTVTVSTSNGTVLWTETNTTQNIILEEIDEAFSSTETFTIAITQTAGACLLNVSATVRQGSSAPLGSISSIDVTDRSGRDLGVATIGSFPAMLVVSTLNSTTTPMGIAGTFTGLAEDITNYQTLDVNVYGTPSNAQGTLYFEFSPNGTNWDVSIPNQINDLNVVIPVPLRSVLPYFRVRYVNGSVAQTTVRITTVLHRFDAGGLTRTLNQVISPSDPVTLTRAMVEPSPLGEQKFLGADREVFGSGIIANRVNQIDADFSKSIANNLVTSTVTNGGATAQSAGQATLTTGTNVSGTAKLVTANSTKYVPGREIFAIFTARFTTPTSANSNQRAGLYDDNNGFFLGYQGTAFGFTSRKAGADTFVALSAANGDPLNATFLSRFARGGVLESIDVTKMNVWRIRFGWLGSSIVKFEVQSPDGIWMVVHTIRQPNTSTLPHIDSPNLPIRMEVVKAASDATSLVMGTGSWAAGITTDVSGLDPSQVHSRTHVESAISAVTVDTTVYTVTTGRILKVKSIALSVTATAGNNVSLVIRDGVGGTIKFPIDVHSNTTDSISLAFDEPMQFSTSFYADILSTNCQVSAMFTGYEEAA